MDESQQTNPNDKKARLNRKLERLHRHSETFSQTLERIWPHRM